jgi:hypothetical protein
MPLTEGRVEKPWSENFNLYSEGNADLRRELTEMLSKNISELQNAVLHLYHPEGADHYKRILHKITTTLSFLGDTEFENVVHQIPIALRSADENKLKELIEQFHHLSARLLEGLNEELNG